MNIYTTNYVKKKNNDYLLPPLPLPFLHPGLFALKRQAIPNYSAPFKIISPYVGPL